ncbi:L-Lysine--8-amino-7-oxononanoate transaminase [bioreactor metagenome]|uniref:L-Lysine--8-amino-7-oxononanoate transaminase n=1 Tax=bioreactor metagenome TaxID=1076179 RepID=A0A645FNR2_9ZZZZ
MLESLSAKIKLIGTKLAEINKLTHVGDARQCGMITGIELMKDKQAKTPFAWSDAIGAKVCLHARKYGLFIRPVGDVVVFMPPLSSSSAELEDMLSIIHRAIKEVTEFSDCSPKFPDMAAISV